MLIDSPPNSQCKSSLSLLHCGQPFSILFLPALALLDLNSGFLLVHLVLMVRQRSSVDSQAPWAIGQVRPVAQQALLPSPRASDPIPCSGPTYHMAPLPRGHSSFHLEWMPGTSNPHDLFHVDHMSAVLNFAFLSLTPYMNPREILLPPFLFVSQNENSEKNAVKWKWSFGEKRGVNIT